MKLNIFLLIGIAFTLLTAMAARAAGPVVTVSKVDETSVTGTLAPSFICSFRSISIT